MSVTLLAASREERPVRSKSTKRRRTQLITTINPKLEIPFRRACEERNFSRGRVLDVLIADWLIKIGELTEENKVEFNISIQ